MAYRSASLGFGLGVGLEVGRGVGLGEAVGAAVGDMDVGRDGDGDEVPFCTAGVGVTSF